MGRLSTIGLHVLTILDQLLLIITISLTCFTRQATLMRWSTVLSVSPQLAFPGFIRVTPEEPPPSFQRFLRRRFFLFSASTFSTVPPTHSKSNFAKKNFVERVLHRSRYPSHSPSLPAAFFRRDSSVDNVAKLFSSLLTKRQNKLDYFSLKSLFNLV